MFRAFTQNIRNCRKILLIFFMILSVNAMYAKDNTIIVFSTFGRFADPAAPAVEANYNVQMQVLDSLVEIFGDGSAEMRQAEKITANSTNTVFTVKLRDDIYWSDGAPVVANDFVSTVEIISNSTSRLGESGAMRLIKGFKGNSSSQKEGSLGFYAVGDKIIKMEYITPVSMHQVYKDLADPETFPRPTHIVEKYGEDWVKLENLVANGPMLPVEYPDEVSVIMERNPYYKQKNIAYDRVIFTETLFDGIAFNDVMNDKYDAVLLASARNFSNWVDRPESEVAPSSGTSILHFLSFGQKNGAMGDERIRKAISMAIDREQMTSRLRNPISFEPAYTIGGGDNSMKNWDLPIPSWAGKQNLEKARQLMKEAGYNSANHLNVTMKISNEAFSDTVGNAMKYFLHSIYIDVDLVLEPTPDHYVSIFDKPESYDLAHLIWFTTEVYADSVYAGAFGEAITNVFPVDPAPYRENFLALMEETDPFEKEQIAHVIEQDTQDQVALVPLFKSGFGLVTFGGSERVVQISNKSTNIFDVRLMKRLPE